MFLYSHTYRQGSLPDLAPSLVVYVRANSTHLNFVENPQRLLKISKNRRKSQTRYLEKGVLELCWATRIKPRQIERSGYFLLDCNWQTRVYGLVSGQPDEWLWRNATSNLVGPPWLNQDMTCTLLFCSTGPQRKNSSLRTGLRSTRCMVLEKLWFSDKGCLIPPCWLGLKVLKKSMICRRVACSETFNLSCWIDEDFSKDVIYWMSEQCK